MDKKSTISHKPTQKISQAAKDLIAKNPSASGSGGGGHCQGGGHW